jgi:hypothetical protein
MQRSSWAAVRLTGRELRQMNGLYLYICFQPVERTLALKYCIVVRAQER